MGVGGVTFDVIACVVGTVVITCGGCESRDDVFLGLNFPEPRQQVLESTIFLYLLRCTVFVYRYVSLILISLRSKPVPVAA